MFFMGRQRGCVLFTIKLYRSDTCRITAFDTAGRFLKAGDIVAFQITNPNHFAIDVSLLFIDSGYGITAYFPEPGIIDDNRLPPGKTIITPRAEIIGDTFGLESLITIAIKAGKERIDFSCLEQPTLDLASRGERGKRAMESLLGHLFKAVLFGEFGENLENRGMRTLELDNYMLHLLSWRTLHSIC